jgi:hypothetical protein
MMASNPAILPICSKAEGRAANSAGNMLARLRLSTMTFELFDVPHGKARIIGANPWSAVIFTAVVREKTQSLVRLTLTGAAQRRARAFSA